MKSREQYQSLSRLTPWVCVDLEINPEAKSLVSAGVIYLTQGNEPVSQTFKGKESGTLFDLLDSLLRQDAVLIGHNLRRHDLPWLTRIDSEFIPPKYCVDTLELFPIAYPSVRSFALDKKYKEKVYRNPVDDPLIGKKRKNHPALDCRGTMLLLESIIKVFNEIPDPNLVDAYRVLLGLDGVFGAGNRKLLGDGKEIGSFTAFEQALGGNFCSTAFEKIKGEPESESRARSLAYILSLIPADPDKRPSTPRPWVRHSHPEVVELIKVLRGTNCGKCEYCKHRFDLLKQIDKLFEFDRNAQWLNEGQRNITESIMAGKSVLGVLPTSGGKSLTFQLPALINANNTGALTVVLSPLRSLMDDQVNQLKDQHGRDDVCQISGKLNSIEKQKYLRSVRAEKTDEVSAVPAHIVYMAPEQLRSISVIRALASRGIGLLVIDEAHCMAKWGKDFRVEYRFIPDLIARLCNEYHLPKPPVLCLTATARKEVLTEISDRFREGMEIDIEIQDHGHARDNLEFSSIAFDEGSDNEKYALLIEMLTPIYEADEASLIFCSTRKQTENLSTKLRNEGFTEVAFYHGKCDREHRDRVQGEFINGDIRLIVATNAFGMGVDKKDIRLIVHYDVPGSLENYIQEAGRAGRDGLQSRCVLFYDPGDLDTQLDLRRRNQLRLNELKRIVLTIRLRYKQAIKQGEEFPEILISALDLLTTKIDLRELMGQDDEDSAEGKEGMREHYDEEDESINQKVTTALGILEESRHLSRHENVFQFVSVPFRVKAWDRIEELINNAPIADSLKAVLRSLAVYLFDRTTARDEKGAVDLEILADQLGMERRAVKEHIDKLRGLGVCNWGREYVIRWDRQIESSSKRRLDYHLGLLRFLVREIDENPEITYSTGTESEEINLNNIRSGSSKEMNGEYYDNRQVGQDLGLLSDWGLFTVDRRQRGKMWVNWSGDLEIVKERLARLIQVSHMILSYFDEHQDRRGIVTNKFNYEQFKRWHSSQPGLFNKECPEEVECEEALLYMDLRKVVNVIDGFGVLRARMKLIPSPDRLFERYRPSFTRYEAYAKSTIAQVKAMGRFAHLLSSDPILVEKYVEDYFSLEWNSFTLNHFPASERKNLHIPIRTEHFEQVFGSLTKEQLEAVQAPTNKNHLILAGPGSGKTHVLVLRVFYLIKVRNVPARSIAVLAYNRHAAIELRRRLKKLLPYDWYEIGVHTFHGLALRLIGRDRLHELQVDAKDKNEKSDVFLQILTELAETLESYSGETEHEQLRWIDKLSGVEYLLVDEFQDISEGEYRIVKLLSRRESTSREGAVHVMAVGDDDQNLYAFRGSSVKWIQQFEIDFDTGEPITLPDNFRSVQGVIETASRFISSNEKRLKTKAWIQQIPESLKDARQQLSNLDPDQGKVIRLNVKDPADARYAIASEIDRIRSSFPDIKLGQICVAHHTNSEAHLTNKLFDRIGVVSQVLGEHQFAPRYQIGVVETIQELEQLDQDKSNISYNRLTSLIRSKFSELKIHDSWMQSWGTFLDTNLLDISPDTEMPVRKIMWRIDEHLIGRSGNAVPPDKVACLTLHGTKGLEFHTVFLFPHRFGKDIEELRRLYFVGLSRAKVKAYLIDWPECESILWDEMEDLAGDWLTRRNPIPGTGKPSDDDRDLAGSFKYFDAYRQRLGTGMNIFFVGDQKEILSLRKNQQIQWEVGKTKSRKLKLELKRNNRCIGMLKQDAIQVLKQEVNGDWDRILNVEVAQVIQTDTEVDKREYNEGSETHYYVVPRIFYRKC